MTATPTLSLDSYAERLEVPGHLIEYLYDDYLECEGEQDFGLFIADRIAEAVYLATVYNTGDVDLADEQSAEVFSEVATLLDVITEVD